MCLVRVLVADLLMVEEQQFEALWKVVEGPPESLSPVERHTEVDGCYETSATEVVMAPGMA